jgi:hypothetical protein
MSETNTAGAAGTAPNADQEARARMMGWKPKAEFKGNEEQWLPADEFLDRGFASPAIMADRLKVMGDRMQKWERDNQGLTTKLDEALSTINTMTGMVRTSERRGYERARAELEAERIKAVESGDTASFARLDKQIVELDKTAPPATVVAPVPPVPPTNPANPTRTTTTVDPAVQAFYQRNPWYTRDPVLTQEADMYHTGLLTTQPGMTIEQNLAEVERRLRTAYPDRFGVVQQQSQNQGDGGTAENPRRDEPGAVSPSGNGTQRTRQQNRRTFAAMPEDSKVAFRRYKQQLTGKGEPLTEDEWAAEYWAQFEEVP